MTMKGVIAFIYKLKNNKMANPQENPVTFRPTELSRRIIKTNLDNTGMNQNALINYFIENNPSKITPIINKHQATIAGNSLTIEAHETEIDKLKTERSELISNLEELRSQIDFLNEEKINYVPDDEDNNEHLEKIKQLQSEIYEGQSHINELNQHIRELKLDIDEELFEKCLNKVFGISVTVSGDSSKREFLIMSKSDLIDALVYQYSLHLKCLDVEIEED
jgi:ribosomal 50S subunit-associated protein YjgA (DUF615 family)